MNWGNAIVLVFVAFAAVIISMVIICMKQDDLHLVIPNYYEEEIKYQQHIDRVANAETLADGILLFDDRLKVVDLHLPVGAKGTLHFFRPSDARLDQKLEFDITEDASKNIDVTGLKAGYWRVKLTWSEGEKDYFLERKINR